MIGDQYDRPFRPSRK